MTYSHQPHTKGGQTEPTRRRSQKSTLTTADLIAQKQESILFAHTELTKAWNEENALQVQTWQAILKDQSDGLALLMKMQAEEAGG